MFHCSLFISVLLLGATLAGCATAQPVPVERPPQPEPIIIDLQAFADWRKDFRKKALADGISATTFDAALADVTPVLSVKEANERQPETTRPVWEYLKTAASDLRISGGRKRIADYQGTLGKVEREYGVEARFLVAIWGLESSYGANTGGYNVFAALATLAYEGRRAAFGERELMSALKIVERGDKPAADMIGSWAGAMGQTQFIPSTYLGYAVDGDGDGRRDLFASIPDVMASTSNYLAKSGWQTGESWGQEVLLPPGFDYALADPAIKMPMQRWHEMGVKNVAGELVVGGEAEAIMLLPAGHRGPAFLTLNNFRTILRYNNSTVYALAIGHLADRLMGGAPFQTAWPLDERPLTRTERMELQEMLNTLGYNVGEVDGIVGANTRDGIRSFQKTIDEPPDGFATVALLGKMRAAVSG